MQSRGLARNQGGRDLIQKLKNQNVVVVVVVVVHMSQLGDVVS